MMSNSAKSLAVRLSIVSVAAVVANGAVAQDLIKPDGFPSRTITMMVPFGTGGGADQVARAVSRELQEIMGVGIQVVNKPGAGGLTALPDFMVAAADGYTILQHTDGIVTGFAAGASQVEVGVDAFPICILQVAFSMMLINPADTRFSDWESLVDYAKSSEQSLMVASSSGVGSHEHVTTMQVAEAADIELEVVPFGDPGERYSSIIGGHVDMLFDQAGDSMPYVREGQLKPVLIIQKESPEVFADVPSLTDAGLDFAPTVKTRGLYVRADTPEPVRNYLAAACEQAYETERYMAFNESTFTHLVRSFYNAEDALKLSNEMTDTYRKMFADLGVTN